MRKFEIKFNLSTSTLAAYELSTQVHILCMRSATIS